MGEQKGSGGAPKPRRSFGGRWLRRLLWLGVAVFIALGVGFWRKTGQLPWSDPESFRRYSIDTLTWAKDEGAKVAAVAKERIEKIEWTRESQQLYEKAVRFLGRAPEGAPAVRPEPSDTQLVRPEPSDTQSVRPEPSGAPGAPLESKGAAGSEAMPGPGGRALPGYLEAYRAGYKAYRDGCEHFADARPGSSKNRIAELKSAQRKFQEAQEKFAEAAELRERDPRLAELQVEVTQFLKEIRTQLQRASY